METDGKDRPDVAKLLNLPEVSFRLRERKYREN
jgi:hypothetical protein